MSLDDVWSVCSALPLPHRPAVPEASLPAAVLVVCFEEEGEARVILTKRPDTMAFHQGEIAFPGGKLDPAVDLDLRAAALREAHEEIGLVPDEVEVVAELEPLITVAAQFVLTPFVALLPGRPVVVPDPTEVAAVFDVAIFELLDDAVYREERWDIPPGLGVTAGPDRPMPFFELSGETVWGATAKILVSFLSHLVTGR